MSNSGKTESASRLAPFEVSLWMDFILAISGQTHPINVTFQLKREGSASPGQSRSGKSLDVVYFGYTGLISPKNVMLQLNERDLPVEASPFQVSLWMEFIVSSWDM